MAGDKCKHCGHYDVEDCPDCRNGTRSVALVGSRTCDNCKGSSKVCRHCGGAQD